MELYHTVQVTSAKIKASGSLSLLENNEEYIALVSKHLPREIAWKWCEEELTGWSNFFNYLERKAKTAKKMLTNGSINATLSGEGDKHKCSLCHKSHSGKCHKPKNAAVINQGSKQMCPVCNKSAHKYKTKTGAEGILKCVKDCPSFKSANDEQKQEMVKKLKLKLPICMKCSGWSHKSEVCNCRLHSNKCNEVPINDLCNLKKFFSCSLSYNK